MVSAWLIDTEHDWGFTAAAKAYRELQLSGALKDERQPCKDDVLSEASNTSDKDSAMETEEAISILKPDAINVSDSMESPDSDVELPKGGGDDEPMSLGTGALSSGAIRVEVHAKDECLDLQDALPPIKEQIEDYSNDPKFCAPLGLSVAAEDGNDVLPLCEECSSPVLIRHRSNCVDGHPDRVVRELQTRSHDFVQEKRPNMLRRSMQRLTKSISAAAHPRKQSNTKQKPFKGLKKAFNKLKPTAFGRHKNRQLTIAAA